MQIAAGNNKGTDIDYSGEIKRKTILLTTEKYIH